MASPPAFRTKKSRRESLRLPYPISGQCRYTGSRIDTGSLWAALRFTRLRDGSGKPSAGNGGKGSRRTAVEYACYSSVAADSFAASHAHESIDNTIHVVPKEGRAIDRVGSKVEHGSAAGVEL